MRADLAADGPGPLLRAARPRRRGHLQRALVQHRADLHAGHGLPLRVPRARAGAAKRIRIRAREPEPYSKLFGARSRLHRSKDIL